MIVVPGLLPIVGWVLLAALVVHEAVFMVRHLTCKPDHCHCPLTHKLLAGLPLHGHTVTDATYWRAANRDLTPAKNVGPWLKLPGWKRRLYRTGPVLAASALMVALVPSAVLLGILGVCWFARRTNWGRRMVRRAVGFLLAPLRTDRARRVLDRLPVWLRTPRHRNRVQTMGMLLGTVTGTAASVAEAGIEWNPGYAAAEPGEEVARWVLPRGFRATTSDKNQVAEVWQSRLGLALTFSWHLDVDEPVLVMKRSREMPSIVYLDDVRERVEALPDTETAIGLDDKSNLVCWSWTLENPHGMVVAGSRHGKTELNRSITAQVVAKGGRVGGVDCKRISFQGLENLPGFTLRNDPRNIRAMWELVGEFYDEMERRSLERLADQDAVFPRWLLIIEEVNQFSAMSDDWWEEMDAEDPRDENTLFWKPKRGKKTPRTWRWVKSLCWEGAEFGIHVIVDGQDGEFQALKGVRNVLGMRLLGGYQPQQWKNCVGTTPVPEAPSQKGRFCLVSGGQTWVQALCAHKDKNESAAIWRDFALTGRRLNGVPDEAVPVPMASGAAGLPDLGKQGEDATVPVELGQPEALKLSEILDRGLLPGMTLDALRKASLRWDDFPEVIGRDGPANKYNPDEVIECVQNHRLRVVS